MRRVLLSCCGLFLGLVAGVILWNSPLWYINDDDPVPIALTRTAGLALIVQGAVAALAAAVCLGRALAPLTLAPAASGRAPAAVGGGPVLPICGLLFLLAAFGPLGQYQRESKEYAVEQSRPHHARLPSGRAHRHRQILPSTCSRR